MRAHAIEQAQQIIRKEAKHVCKKCKNLLAEHLQPLQSH